MILFIIHNPIEVYPTLIKASIYCCSFIFMIFSLIASHILLNIILLRSGDIERNPGPSNSTDCTDSRSSDGDDISCVLKSNTSIVHMNVQSIRNKLDLLAV